MNNIIEVEDLSFDYGTRRAVDHLTFLVKPGEVIGLLGPNGAGKTTTIRLANGLLTPSNGRVCILGMDPFLEGSKVRRQTGVLTETPALYERLTALQNLEFFGTLSGMRRGEIGRRSQELLTYFDLSMRSKDRVASFSKGMKQRLALARAMLPEPPILFLDEPTSGMDPEAALHVLQLIASLRQNGRHTIILCTHQLHEAEGLCDRMVIMDNGKLLSMGSLDDLRREISADLVTEINLSTSPLETDWSNIAYTVQGIKSAHFDPSRSVLVVSSAGEETIPLLINRLVENKAGILSVLPKIPSLQDIYFKLVRMQEGGIQ